VGAPGRRPELDGVDRPWARPVHLGRHRPRASAAPHPPGEGVRRRGASSPRHHKLAADGGLGGAGRARAVDGETGPLIPTPLVEFGYGCEEVRTYGGTVRPHLHPDGSRDTSIQTSKPERSFRSPYATATGTIDLATRRFILNMSNR